MELEASRAFGNGLTAQATVSYTNGEGDYGNLGRISPLEGQVRLDYNS